MPITFHNDGSNYRLAEKRKIARWVAECIRHQSLKSGEIAYIFCSPEKHLEINRTYLGHDYPTDVITFDYSDLEAGVVSGDIFIDPVTVADNAETFDTTAELEMLRVLIHGVLHLCGNGDKTNEEQLEMRAKEDACLLLFPKD